MLPRVLRRAGEREADDGAERPQECEVLAGLEPTRACDRGQERAEGLAGGSCDGCVRCRTPRK
jgi:hypothetical protein